MSRIFAGSPGPDHVIPAVRTDFASLILRAGLATVFLYHGLEKVLGPDNRYGAVWLENLLELSAVSTSFRVLQLIIAWGEVVGGAAIAMGLLTRLAAFAMVFIQCGATILAINYDFFSMTKRGGPEYNFVLIVMCAALLLLGAGRFSVDHWLFKKRPGSTDATPTPQPVAADLVPADR